MNDLWKRYKDTLCVAPSIDLSLDVSRMSFDDGYLARMAPAMEKAYAAMDALEKGAIANPDEKRMVGHYWLRDIKRAPTPELTKAVVDAVLSIKSFTNEVHRAGKFKRILCVGIGGSALGPMFVADALGDPKADRMTPYFIDNTDPDGIARVLRSLEGKLGETLTIVTSKSGSTPEPRNGMLAVAAAYRAAGLDFAKHAVAVTGAGSALDKEAQGWLARFPMWDWVGGRTSEFSAVGLLPAALQGLDIAAMLEGARACDEVTRVHDTKKNPAALMALMWYHATDGKGRKDLVVLPYKDRLLLFSRYLQQLIMESLGKRLDLQGKRVDQGITVYGNKGSTDQHAYVQQLRDGVPNFFVTFIRVLESGGADLEVEPGVTSGDYLHGFLLGTRQALFENERESMTISIRRVDARAIGVLIALYERAVGLYATLIDINAYHQPGVEAGKKAAAVVLSLQGNVFAALEAVPQSAEQIAAKVAAGDLVETVYLLLEHLAANGRAASSGGADPGSRTFTRKG
ncbi:MAG TPA: glucose-6-phosphate isomerase [Planctomycetota bacterium]|jgi:glucose-6-phosphate isomerase|nr:glucose-6-phosphate isomerase [Planctomycetota bacterium]